MGYNQLQYYALKKIHLSQMLTFGSDNVHYIAIITLKTQNTVTLH